MANLVLAITGQNANGILECQSQRYLDLIGTMGHGTLLLRMADPAFSAKLRDAAAEGIVFAWGYAGVGAQLEVNGRNFWDLAEAPFISVLADAPYIMPRNHLVPSPWVVNGYVYREWLDLNQECFGSPQITALLPFGVLPNPARDRIPWAERSRRMLFVKGGADPVRQRAAWDQWPARLRTVMNECADLLAVRSPSPIAPIVFACLAAHALVLDGSKPILLGMMHELDTYIRALRATAMAHALLPLAVDIVGDGWEHVQHQPGRARFHPPIPAAELEDIYADTQILVNVTPNFASGAHERVLRGFASRCCVVSDDNDYTRSNLRDIGTYRGVEWYEPDLADRLADAFAEQRATEAELDQAQAYVERRYDPVAFVTRMKELAALARARPMFARYGVKAA